MVEVPDWFLILVSIAVFAAARRRRHRVAFLHESFDQTG